MYFKSKIFILLVSMLFWTTNAHAFNLSTSPNTKEQNNSVNNQNTHTLNTQQLQAMLQSQLSGQGSVDNISLDSIQQLQKIQSQTGQDFSAQNLLSQGFFGFNPNPPKITTENLNAQLKNKSPEQIMQMLQAGELGQLQMGSDTMYTIPPIVAQMQKMPSHAPASQKAEGADVQQSPSTLQSQAISPYSEAEKTHNANQVHKNPYSFASIVTGMQPIFTPSMVLNAPPLSQTHRNRNQQNTRQSTQDKTQNSIQNEVQDKVQHTTLNAQEFDANYNIVENYTMPMLYQAIPNTLVPDNAPLMESGRLMASSSTQAPYFLNAGKNTTNQQQNQQIIQENNTKQNFSEFQTQEIALTTHNTHPPVTTSKDAMNPLPINTTNNTLPPLTDRRAPHRGVAQDIGIPVLINEHTLDTKENRNTSQANLQNIPVQNPLNLTSIIPPDTNTPSSSPYSRNNPSTNLVQIVELDAVDTEKRTQIQETKSLESILDDLSLNDLGVRAKSGDSVAQYKLGIHYYLGTKVEKDIKTAFYWVENAANKGYAPAMVQMGRFYESAELGNVNLKKAGLWYKKAAEVEDAEGLFNLARFYDNGTIGRGEEARRLAMGYYRKSANMGHPEALYQLAKFYNTKEDATRDMGQAVQLYRNSAHLGFAPAQLELGILYELGNFLPQNDANAAAWYTKAALQGLDTAQYLLAGMFLEGRGVPKDMEKAIQLYEAAAFQNLVDAQFDLGILYITSDAPYFNQKKAELWFQKAADNGDMNAFDILQNIQNKNLKR